LGAGGGGVHDRAYMDASLLPRSICGVLTNKNRLQFYIRPVVQENLLALMESADPRLISFLDF
jgi:hypothetical protein